MNRVFYLIAFALLSITGFAQELSVVDMSKEVKSTKELFQPIFSDKALLFYSPEMVWTCQQKGEDYYSHKLFEADITKVRECQCNEETYKLVPMGEAINGVFSSYDYRPVERALRANLLRVNDTLMTYSEFSDDGGTKKVVNFKYNPKTVEATDSLYTETPCGDLELTIRKTLKFVTVK